MKVKREYLKTLDDKSKLGKFVKKYMTNTKNTIFHERFIYFMFIYHFQVDKKQNDSYEIPKISDTVQLPLQEFGITERYTIDVIGSSPAFIIEPDTYHYFLNFPAGQVIMNNGNTLISYGNGDFRSHIVEITRSEMKELVNDINSKTQPSTFKFKRLEPEKN